MPDKPIYRVPLIFCPPLEILREIASGNVHPTVSWQFEKQTLMNRCTLAHAESGETHSITIPVQSSGGKKVPIAQKVISYAENWPEKHLRTLRTLYGNAPFFMEYIEVIEHILLAKFETVGEINIRFQTFLLQSLFDQQERRESWKMDHMYVESLPHSYQKQNRTLSALHVLLTQGPYGGLNTVESSLNKQRFVFPKNRNK